MEMITNPINTITKIQGMKFSDVKKYEKMCIKALKTAKNDVCVVKMKNGEQYITTDAMCKILEALDYRYNVLAQKWDKIHGLFENETKNVPNVNETAQETDVPATIEEIPIPTIENETATGTSNGGETNVNKKLPKKSSKTIAKPKKNNYINTTNETKPTNSNNGDKTMNTNNETKPTNSNNGDKTMNTNNEIAEIAPNAVKNILAAQNKNKTDTKKTYWGGWGKVRAGMKSAYNDYTEYQNLETEWLELRQKLGGMKSAKYHFCWGLINKNRVGVKQEPNSTLRFIKNVKIRIAMANDVLADKYTETQIDDYMNGLSAAYKLKYGLV